MHDPQHPDSVSRGHPGDRGKVIAWYHQEILAAHRSPASAPADWTSCWMSTAHASVTGTASDATGEESERLGALYAARLMELEAAGP